MYITPMIPSTKWWRARMAIIAALLAVVSVLGQHFNTEKLSSQQKSSDQWAFYQAKDIRRYTAMLPERLSSNKVRSQGARQIPSG